MITMLASRLVLSSAESHRWRRVVVPLASFVSALVLAAIVGLFQMVFLEGDRLAARTAYVASSPSSSDLLMLIRDDFWENKQFNVVWIEPVGADLPVLPPGMNELLEPGAFAVSPALDRLCREFPELATRYAHWVILSEQGIVHRGELLAYARPDTGESISSHPATIRVGSIDSSRDGLPGARIGDINVVDLPMLILFASMFLVLPALCLLIVGSLANSEYGRRRHRILLWIGTTPRTLFRLALAETAIVAYPATVAGISVWVLTARFINDVPVMNLDPLAGDLPLRWPVAAALILLLFAMIGMVTILAVAGDIRLDSRVVRPTEDARNPSAMRLMPLILSAGCMIVAGLALPATGRTQTDLYPFYGGLVAFLTSIPLALPTVVKLGGAMLARRQDLASWLAGRFVQYNPIQSARTYAAAGLLIAFAMAGLTLLANVNEEIGTENSRDLEESFQVSWVPQEEQDVDRFALLLPEFSIVPYRYSDSGQGIVLLVACTTLVEEVPGLDCSSFNEAGLLGDKDQELLSGRLGFRGAAITFDELLVSEPVLRAVVLTTGGGEQAEDLVRTAAMQSLIGPTITNGSFSQVQPPEQSTWIFASTIAGSLVLSFVCIISIVDHALRDSPKRFHLARLSLMPRQFRALEIQTFLLPLAIVLFGGLWLGLWLSSMIASLLNGPVPVARLALVGAYSVVLCLLATVCLIRFARLDDPAFH